MDPKSPLSCRLSLPLDQASSSVGLDLLTLNLPELLILMDVELLREIGV